MCALDEVFELIDNGIGINVEIKYPLDEEKVSNGLDGILEIPRYVENVLKVVEKYQNRNIIYSSFHPDVVIYLKLRQASYDVYFITSGGIDQCLDERCNSLYQAHIMCLKYGLDGGVIDSRVLIQAPFTISKILKKSGLKIFTYDESANVREDVAVLLQAGVDGIITDNILGIKSLFD